jgi:hypothetical protein
MSRWTRWLLGLLAAAVVATATLAMAADDAPSTRPKTRIGLLGLEAAPGAEPAWRQLSIAAPRILRQVETELEIHPARYYRIVLVGPLGPRDPELERLDNEAPPWAAAFMVPRLRIGVIRIAEASRYPYGTLEATLAHEATHQLLDDAVGGRIPLWFNEGVATLQGRRWSFQDMVVHSTSLLTQRLPPLAEMDAAFHGDDAQAQLAYSASFGFVSWARSRHGPAFVRDVLREVRTRRFEAAWRHVAGRSLDEDERAWRRVTVLRYRWLPIVTASSTLWLSITLLALAAGVRKRARVRRLREQWDREDAEEQALAERLPDGFEQPNEFERPPELEPRPPSERP